MTHKEIIKTAVNKAIENGWHNHAGAEMLYFRMYFPSGNVLIHTKRDELTTGETFNVPSIIFDHDFAKALWGEEPDSVPYKQIHYFIEKDGTASECRVTLQAWQYHLQQMIIAEDPIAYLGEHLL
jgi:hypothetical protein